MIHSSNSSQNYEDSEKKGFFLKIRLHFGMDKPKNPPTFDKIKYIKPMKTPMSFSQLLKEEQTQVAENKILSNISERTLSSDRDGLMLMLDASNMCENLSSTMLGDSTDFDDRNLFVLNEDVENSMVMETVNWRAKIVGNVEHKSKVCDVNKNVQTKKGINEIGLPWNNVLPAQNFYQFPWETSENGVNRNKKSNRLKLKQHEKSIPFPAQNIKSNLQSARCA